jgi:hypothetical protein
MGQLMIHAFSSLSAEQLKEVIGELEKLRTEKLRAAEAEKQPGRAGPRGNQASRNDELVKKLDKLTQELDEIRKELKK